MWTKISPDVGRLGSKDVKENEMTAENMKINSCIEGNLKVYTYYLLT
jgi:hypothetical protein